MNTPTNASPTAIEAAMAGVAAFIAAIEEHKDDPVAGVIYGKLDKMTTLDRGQQLAAIACCAAKLARIAALHEKAQEEEA